MNIQTYEINDYIAFGDKDLPKVARITGITINVSKNSTVYIWYLVDAYTKDGDQIKVLGSDILSVIQAPKSE